MRTRRRRIRANPIAKRSSPDVLSNAISAVQVTPARAALRIARRGRQRRCAEVTWQAGTRLPRQILSRGMPCCLPGAASTRENASGSGRVLSERNEVAVTAAPLCRCPLSLSDQADSTDADGGPRAESSVTDGPALGEVLKGRDGDRIHAVLAAAGYNFGLLLRWLARLLRALFQALAATSLSVRLV